jgi:hypothetical protein
MKEPMQFEYSMKNFSIDEPFSQMIVAETEDQREAICNIFRASLDDSGLISIDANDVLYMLYSMKKLDKHFFIRENGANKICLQKVNEFAQRCKEGTISDENTPFSLFLVLTGSSGMQMSDISLIHESVIESFCGKATKNLNFIHLLNIDYAKEQPDFIEVSILFNR